MVYSARPRTVSAFAVLLLTLAACAPAANFEDRQTMSDDGRFLSFAGLTPPSSPNAWLIAPDKNVADIGTAPPDEPAPIFAASAEGAAQAWVAMVETQPRTRIAAVSADGLRIEAEQQSAVFGFVDRISARFVPLAQDRSTAAFYSRSGIGYWDLGVNRRRLSVWLAALQARLGEGAGSGRAG